MENGPSRSGSETLHHFDCLMHRKSCFKFVVVQVVKKVQYRSSVLLEGLLQVLAFEPQLSDESSLDDE